MKAKVLDIPINTRVKINNKEDTFIPDMAQWINRIIEIEPSTYKFGWYRAKSYNWAPQWLQIIDEDIIKSKPFINPF